jgi:MFS family permease
MLRIRQFLASLQLLDNFMQHDDSIKPGYIYKTSYTYYVFGLLFLLYMFDYIDRMIVTSMFVHIEKDWGISSTQSGMLVSGVYWSIVVLTLPASLLVDRWSRRKTIGIMAVIWSLATALSALTGNFAQLLMARIVIGAGEAGYSPGGTAMISGLFPQHKRAQMLGIWNASIPLGAAIGVGMGGLIASTIGWRHAFGIVALPGLIVAILFYFIKDYKTAPIVSENHQTYQKPTPKMILNEFIYKPSFLFASFGMAAVIFVITALMTWLPKFFLETNATIINEKEAGFKASVVLLLAIVGAPLGGYLADKWRKKNVKARLFFPTITTLLSAILLFVAINYTPGLTQYLVFLLLGIMISAFAPAIAAVTQDVVQVGLRAVSYSIAVIVQNLLGASIAPVIIGFLIDKYDVVTAFQILPIMLIIAVILFYLASIYYEKDMQKVQITEIDPEE